MQTFRAIRTISILWLVLKVKLALQNLTKIGTIQILHAYVRALEISRSLVIGLIFVIILSFFIVGGFFCLIFSFLYLLPITPLEKASILGVISGVTIITSVFIMTKLLEEKRWIKLSKLDQHISEALQL